MKTIFKNIRFSALLRGVSGLLRPQGPGITALFNADGFTRFDLSGTFTITLVAYQVDFVSITNFQLRATELGPSGGSFSVRVEYYTSVEVVRSFMLIDFLFIP